MSDKIRGLGYMEIGGKSRPFHVNSIRQANAFCEVMNIDKVEYETKIAELGIGGLVSREIIIAFMYSALFAGAKRENIQIDFTYDDVINWVEEADEDDPEMAKPFDVVREIGEKALAKQAEAAKKA